MGKPISQEKSYTEEDLIDSVSELAMLEFFPREEKAAVMTLLRRMVPHKRALDWLVGELVNKIGKWPGPAEVRGVLCTRFDALDGIDRYCSLPGYRACDGEQRTLDKHDQLKAGGFLPEEMRQEIRRLHAASKIMR